MSSYRGAGGAGGAWDGGPPGAEAEYPAAPAPYAAPPPRAMPSTDPWTGVSYSHYGAPPNYDYQAYGAGYGYGYDPSYYQRPDGGYYGKYPDSRTAYPQGQPSYDYPPRSHDASRSPVESRSYNRQKSYRSKSRSGSPYEKRSYSKNREGSYEEGSRRHRSRSRSVKKHTKYSSSDRSSSRSETYSRSSIKKKDNKKKRSTSSESSASGQSYKKNTNDKDHDSSMTPPLKKRSISCSRSRSRSHRTPSVHRSCSKSPRLKDDRKRMKSIDRKSHSTSKSMDRKKRDANTPPRKRSVTPPLKGHKKSDRSSVTPPKSYKNADRSASPPKKNKRKDCESGTPPRKARDNSLTPPKSYARSRSSSKSRSRSSTPRKSQRKRSRTSKTRRGRSSSSSSRSSREGRSLSKSKRRTKNRSRSKSSSKRRSVSKSRSKSRRRSRSRGKGKRSHSQEGSKSRSKSRSSRSRSRSGSGTDDERRGQFTVADRKRFWQLHRSRQEEREKERSPVKELKPPPGAVEPSHMDDIEYGDPPEVEGPNFAELLPSADQLVHGASSSKSKPIPLPIKNDGSFLEMFKKMQEETKKNEEAEKKPEIKKPVLPFIGKRRGGRVLKTGVVKKAKAIDEQSADSTPKDAWSLYMQEVKKYRETSCEEERKTRPLVK